MSDYIIKTDENKIVKVRDIQLVLLEMAKDILDLLERHHISYWLEGGSALGAYRHQGFIPWDDDFDISMMYDDYLKLIKVLDRYLDKDKYTFHCFEKNNKYNVLIPAMKIRKKDTYIEEKNSLLKNKIEDCDGLFIDVFVYDYVSKNKFNDFFNRLINYIIGPIIILLENIGLNPVFLKKLFVSHARKYGHKNRGSKLVGIDLCWIFRNITKPYIYAYNDIFPLKKIKFEDSCFSVPNNIENFLTVTFGSNYNQLPKEVERYAKHTKDVKLNDSQF